MAVKTPTGRSRTSSQAAKTPTWAATTELIGIELELEPIQASSLYAQYTIGLHAWFLDQVRQSNPDLSAILHDEQTEKAFTISGLEGPLLPKGQGFQLQANQTYRWTITALSQPVVHWLHQWLKHPPTIVELRNAPLQVRQIAIALPPTTYKHLWQRDRPIQASVPLSFISPTSFRRKGLHLPLPYPVNLFHSYLRRWNAFSSTPIDQETFLNWVDETVLILHHRLESVRTVAGKKGTVTGFIGAVELGLSAKAKANPDFEHLFYVLTQLAPYCGTGHKTTFGLGQTRLGWHQVTAPATSSLQDHLTQRIAELTDQFMQLRKRTGGDRARKKAETQATILARRELGESLGAIAQDLEMPYETVKTYVKRARYELRENALKE